MDEDDDEEHEKDEESPSKKEDPDDKDDSNCEASVRKLQYEVIAKFSEHSRNLVVKDLGNTENCQMGLTHVPGVPDKLVRPSGRHTLMPGHRFGPHETVSARMIMYVSRTSGGSFIRGRSSSFRSLLRAPTASGGATTMLS